jgi:hypothetical protein
LLEEHEATHRAARSRAFLIRHQSVREWLAAEGDADTQPGPAAEGLTAMHASLADFYLKQRYGPTFVTLQRLTSGPVTLADYGNQKRGLKDWMQVDTYGRFHTPTHLLRSDRAEFVQLACELLTSPEFLQANIGDGEDDGDN